MDDVVVETAWQITIRGSNIIFEARKLSPPMDDGHLRGKAGQEQSFFRGDRRRRSRPFLFRRKRNHRRSRKRKLRARLAAVHAANPANAPTLRLQ